MTPALAASLAGRTALVTGASRGIGAAVARRLAAEGVRVALLARSEAALRDLAAQLGHGAIAIPCDLRRSDAPQVVAAALRTIDAESPDIIVNNAGAFLIAPAHETTVDAFRDTLEVNLVGPFSLVRRFLPAMRARGSGHVVTIGSIADRAAFPGNAAYAASKHGLRALHEVLRAELRGSGVRATLVSPGPVDTELWDPIDPDHQPGFTPRSSMLDADAVAGAVLYVVTAPVSVNVDELRLSRS
ncbi:MAG: SDR family oxidoreductase [Gemmatimonadaceae bacterium]